MVHRHGDRAPIASSVGTFNQTDDLIEFLKGRLPARARLSAWGAVDDEPTETFLASKAPSSSSAGWPNGPLTVADHCCVAALWLTQGQQ